MYFLSMNSCEWNNAILIGKLLKEVHAYEDLKDSIALISTRQELVRDLE